MDRIVSQPFSRQTRPALNDRDGRSLPEIGRPPTARSDMAKATARTRSRIPTRARATARLQLGFRGIQAERTRHPHPQVIGYLLTALVGDHDAQLGLEVIGLEAGRTFIEMVLDQLSPVRGQLTVEIDVQLMNCVATLVVLFTHVGAHPR